MASAFKPLDIRMPYGLESDGGEVRIPERKILRASKLTPAREAILGWLIAGAGMIWIANFVGRHHASHWPEQALRICLLGATLWLHAKWRGSVKLR